MTDGTKKVRGILPYEWDELLFPYFSGVDREGTPGMVPQTTPSHPQC